MKTLPAPEVPGNAVSMLFSTSKEAFVKAETKQRARNRKKLAERPHSRIYRV
jgi:hypothetical protein